MQKRLLCKRGHARTPNNLDSKGSCRQCLSITKRVWVYIHNERHKQQCRDRYLTRNRESYFKTTYGLSLADIDALLEAQGNKCMICKTPFSNDVKSLVDHCHITQKVRGILCVKCNTGIGMFNDSLDNLIRAFVYLRGDLQHQ